MAVTEVLKSILDQQERLARSLRFPSSLTAISDIFNAQQQMMEGFFPNHAYMDSISRVPSVVEASMARLNSVASVIARCDDIYQPNITAFDLASRLPNTIDTLSSAALTMPQKWDAISEAAASMSRPLDGLSESVSIANRYQYLVDSIAPSRAAVNAIESIQRSFEARYTILATSALPTVGVRTITDSLRFAHDLAKEHQWTAPEVVVHSDGSFSVAGQNVTIDDIEQVLEDISEEIELKWDKTALWIKNYLGKVPQALRWIVVGILLQLALNIVANLLTPWFENQLSGDRPNVPATTQKQVNDIVVRAFGEEQLDGFAFVTATILKVRTRATTKSPIVGELYGGDVVQIVSKNRAWSLVTYQDTLTGEPATGWVFSRYLRKFQLRVGALRQRGR